MFEESSGSEFDMCPVLTCDTETGTANDSIVRLSCVTIFLAQVEELSEYHPFLYLKVFLCVRRLSRNMHVLFASGPLRVDMWCVAFFGRMTKFASKLCVCDSAESE